MAKPTIAGTALELLRTRRVATAEEITEVVVARRLTRAKDPLRAVRGALDASPRLQQLDDGRWASLEILLDGATLTHELTAAEAAAGALAIDADDVGIWMVRFGRSLPDGGELDGLIFNEARRRVGPDCHRALAGPEGWLPATPGTFLHLRIDDEMLHVEPGPRPGAGARTAERRFADIARACIERAVFGEEDGVVDVTRVLLHALVETPDLLASPIRPLGEVLRDAGLEVFESLVGKAGTDWRGRGWAAWASLGIDDDDDEDEDGFGEDDEDEDDPGSAPDPSRELEQLRERYDLDDVQVRLLEFVFAALLLERLEEPLTDETSMQAVATALRDPLLAVIVSDRVIGDPAVGSLLRRVVETAEPERTAGAWHVLGVAADMDGDPDAAEAHLRAALRIDRDFWPAMGMLSRLAEERGDLVEALRLVVRAGVPPDDPARERLASAVAPVGPKVGRNDPCPCGSGRKSKVCHPDGVGAITLSPARRLRWILGVWGERPEVHLTTHEILAEAGIRADHDIPVGSEDDSPDGDARWMMCHTLAADIALFDEGHLADLLRVRGHRLPPDLLPLARTWLETSRSIVEVRAVAPDRGVTVRDLADGVVGELDDRVLARQVKPLDLLCARLLSDGGGGWIVNDAFRVPRGQRERVTTIVREGDGVELLEWLDDPSPPLHLRTPEGDELVRVRSTWVVPGDEEARTRLARLPEVRSDDPDHYTLVQPIDDRDSIVGTITFTGDEATLEAMSPGRARRLGVLLRSVAPRARVMRSSRQSATAMLREARTMEPIPAPDLGPEADAFLDEFMQQQERRWVDESIPALGGLTPRQALEDPVGRPRLDALLDDFAWQERQEMVGLQRPNTGGMQVRRIRALLGIGPGPGLD